ncbi:DUF4097 family beta strand repeat protein [Paenibacillus athensensis]|uniref:DUF4097 domain-containing protein n=1 Tax=Paenibacillus athensensis TaxID=1967502 RepID=A0A4Y8PT55_9BACL|nr:DUF4097 family beta strand repeat-containing protein [Paenibacillus athensensis]MCD1258004.1 DUF4097 family beta strand repeat protein [Paenibacillus athensensis]
MSFRIKKIVLLPVVVLLFLGLIVDIRVGKEQMLEHFGDRFVNEQRADAYREEQTGTTASAERELEIRPNEQIKEVALTGLRGTIAVQRSVDASIRLHYSVKASGPDRETASRRLDAVKVDEAVAGGRIDLTARSDGKTINPDIIAVDYRLELPDAVNLVLTSTGDTVQIRDIRGDVEAISDVGSLALIGVTGKLKVKLANGSAYLSAITGDIELDNRNGTVNIEDVKGNLVLTSRIGRNIVAKLTGNVTGTAESGPIQLQDVTGDVLLNGQDAYLQTERIHGHTQVTADRGDVTLLLSAGEGYTLEAAVDGGRIQTMLPSDVQVMKDGDYAYRMDGVIGAGTWKLSAKARSGDIHVYLK